MFKFEIVKSSTERERQTDRQRQTERETETERDKETERDRETVRQTDRQTDRDRETEREAGFSIETIKQLIYRPWTLNFRQSTQNGIRCQDRLKNSCVNIDK